MNLKEVFNSNKTKKILWAIGVLIVILFVFGAGAVVGYRQAIFSSKSGENYYRNIYGGQEGFLEMFMDHDRISNTTNSHGTAGTIIDIASSTIIIKDQGNNERFIGISSGTVVRAGRATADLSALKIGDNIAVIGGPNNRGQIEANFIRIFGSSSEPFMASPGPPPGPPPMIPFASEAGPIK